MSNTIVYQGQSFLDKVIEMTGSIDNVFEMALLNGKSITDELTIGEKLESTGVTNSFVTSLFGQHHRPASTIPMVDQAGQDGIDYMEIEENFIVA